MRSVHQPPKFFQRFFKWYCHPRLLKHLEGDLLEFYNERIQESGKRKADLNFIVDVLQLFRPGIIKPAERLDMINPYGMYKNYLKVAVRNLLRHRSFTFINTAGLTLGIACALFIFLIVSYELSYDQYHTNIDRLYRINRGSPMEDGADTGTPSGLAGVLRSEFPEVKEAAIIFRLNPEQSNVEINNELFREQGTYIVQPQFFRMFDFQWTKGNADKSLAGANQVAIAQSVADKYFEGDAIGKILRLNNEFNMTVTGIFADPPVNSDFPVKIAISFATLEANNPEYASDKLDGGTNTYLQTYVLLHNSVDAGTIDARLKQMVEKHLGKEQAEKYLAFRIQPVSDIHFNIGNFNQRIISRDTIKTLQLIGIFVLIIACINFINLASAQAIKRAKEVGIRKTLGSSRHSLVVQFLCETFLVTLVSLIVAFGVSSQLVSFSSPLFNIPLSPEALFTRETFFFMGSILILVTLLSGFYPAFVLSGYRPVSALKGAGSTGGKGGLLVRKGLITFQFLISQVLIVCTILVIRQTDHFLSKPLGFNKEAVVTFDLPRHDEANLSTLRNNLMSHSEIKAVSFSLNTPSAIINKWWANTQHVSFGGEPRSAEVKFMDSTYLRLFEIKTVAGSVTIPDNKGTSIVVNESMVKELGFDDPQKVLGEKIKYWDVDATIIGVVQDFQTVTLAQGMHSVILTTSDLYFTKGSVKIDMAHAQDAVALIEKHWKEAFPKDYFTYAFLDDQLATFYKEEKKMSRLLVTFASVAIAIGCIGLFGLIAFVATQRSKEVSIRKILGATLSQLAALLTRDFVILVLVAGAIACPIAWYVIEKWLEGFENKIVLLENAWAFVLAVVLAALFALITVSFQTVKAALANPADSLRSE